MAGWSLGGGAAVYAALDAVNDALNPQGLSRFVAHLGMCEYTSNPFVAVFYSTSLADCL